MRISILFCIVLLLVACGTPRSSADSARALSGRTWYIVAVRSERVNNEFDTRSPQLSFIGDAVAGSGGCNALSGTVTIDGDDLQFGPIASTRMMCEQAPLENRILKTLAEVRHYSANGERLLLMGERLTDTLLICSPAVHQ